MTQPRTDTLEQALAQNRFEWWDSLCELGRELKRDKPGLIGVILVTVLVLMAVFAPYIAPHDPAAQDLTARLAPPVWYDKGSWSHIWARTIWGGMCCPGPFTVPGSRCGSERPWCCVPAVSA